MLSKMIPHFEEDTVVLRKLANVGFTACFNFTFTGPEYIHSEYPEAWRQEYESHSYYAMDPVLMWAMTHQGHKRWSEIQLPDVRKILKRGAEFGLNYGAVIGVKQDRTRSFLTLARSDREFEESEIDQISTIFAQWCDAVRTA